jgi:hypothetical protein
MVNVGIFYDYLAYFMAIGYNLWPFWYSLLSFVIFFPKFGMFGPRKIRQPWRCWLPLKSEQIFRGKSFEKTVFSEIPRKISRKLIFHGKKIHEKSNSYDF